MVAPDALLCFTEHAQTPLDIHAARKRWGGICRRFVVERAAGIREQAAELAEAGKAAARKKRKRAELRQSGIPK